MNTRSLIMLALVLFGAVTLLGQVRAHARGDWRDDQCRYQGLEHPKWTDHEEHRTARCVVAKWDPVSLSEFDSIISCESGWNRLAYNPGGPYVGLGQHLLSAWAARVRTFTPAHWTLRPSWTNSRTMLVVTARMMDRYGTGPWSCA